MKREIAIAIFRNQFFGGIVFAIAGCAFAWLIYNQFRDSGVPTTGSGTPLAARDVALTIAAIAVVLGAGASYVAKVALKRAE